jgi:hypothetical protein
MPGLKRNALDQFYTREDIALNCVNVLRSFMDTNRVWIEPSAGEGVFLKYVPEAIGYDIDPKNSRIQKANFLDISIPEGCVIFGNPPFGRQGTLAKQFIKHAGAHAKWIGFILPRSFVKPSMQNAFPPLFHLKHTEDLPKKAFIIDGTPYHVPCVFQIWKKELEPRTVDTVHIAKGFIFVKKIEKYTLAFRRVGGYAGRCSLPEDNLSTQTHYFIRLEDPTSAQFIVDESHRHTFPTNTTGPRSLSKGEAIHFLNAAITSARPSIN